MTGGGGLDGKIYKMYKKDFYAQCKYLCVQFFVWYIQISLNISLDLQEQHGTIWRKYTRF